MPLKFFFDECVYEGIAAALRAHNLDVRTTTDFGRKAPAMRSSSQFAHAERRVIYTTDKDFLRLAHRYLKEGETFAGVAYHQQGQRSKQVAYNQQGQRSKHQVIETLLLTNTLYDSDDVQNRVEFI